MTLPDERYRAVLQARDFLRELLDPKATPKVPKDIRRRAAAALRHYPHEYEMQIAETNFDMVFKVPKSNKRSK